MGPLGRLCGHSSPIYLPHENLKDGPRIKRLRWRERGRRGALDSHPRGGRMPNHCLPMRRALRLRCHSLLRCSFYKRGALLGDHDRRGVRVR